MGIVRRELRRFERAAFVISAVVGAFLIASSAVASAAVTHPFIGSFGPDGTPATTFEHPGAIAIDQSSGDLYAADLALGTVYKFGPEGESREFSALGSHEIAGFSFHSEEAGVSEIAINSATHDLYVVENTPVNSIKVLHADGEPGEFSSLGSDELGGFAEACGVAVDANGAIYVGDFSGGVSVYAPSGELLTSFAVEESCNLAVDSTGSLYVNHWQGRVEKAAPSEFPVTAATTYATSVEAVDPGPAFGVAVDPSNDDLYVDGGSFVSQYDASGALLGKSAAGGEGAVTGSEGLAIEGSSGRLFAGDNGSRLIKRYGPGEVEKPQIESVWASPVGVTGATLHAEIDPRGVQSSVHFEFGEEDCATSACSETPAIDLGNSPIGQPIDAALEGLTAGTTYHFRVVVASELGPIASPDRTFTTFGPSQGSNFAPADGRGLELVSPADQSDAEVGVPFAAGGLINDSVKPQRAAEDGEAIGYASFTAFGNPQAAPAASYYVSRRGDGGWTTQNITPTDTTTGLSGPIRNFSPDLATSGVVSVGALLAPGAVPGFQNLYLRDNESGALRALTTETPAFTSPGKFCVNYIGQSAGAEHVLLAASGALTPDSPAPPEERGQNLYEWTPTGGMRLVSVLPDESAAEPKESTGFGPGSDNCSINQTLITRHPVSDDGSRIFWTNHPASDLEPELLARVDGTETIQLDAADGGEDPSGGGVFWDASSDGSRVFFTDSKRLVPGATQGRPNGSGGDLYEYDLDAEHLTDLTPGSEPTEVLGVSGASEDGAFVYFVALGNLDAGAKAGRPNLYVAHEGAVRFIATLSAETDVRDWTSSFLEQTARVTPDGRHLAFVSTERLTGYDNRIGGAAACARDFPDGPLAGGPFGGKGCSEVYLYDAASASLACASCNPSGANPVGPVQLDKVPVNSLPVWATPFEQPRYLSDDGRRLFFESFESLVPRDTNRRRDVYEFEQSGEGSCTADSPSFAAESGGCVFLVSSGDSSDASYFVDASSGGGDIFISTRQRLVGADTDNRFDVYDSRVGGGFPEPQSPPQPCSGEACRPAGAAQGEQAAPGSSGFHGEGNVKPVKCPRGKVKRNDRCVAKPHRRRHHRAHRRTHTTGRTHR